MTDKPANTPKNKRKAPKTAWPKGVSGNPAGRPKEGESQSGIISYLLNCTPEQLSEMVGGKNTDLGRAFMQMPQKTQMKYLIPLRGMAAFMFEPNNSLWTTILDRTEGKVAQKIEGDVKFGWKQFLENENPDAGTDS